MVSLTDSKSQESSTERQELCFSTLTAKLLLSTQRYPSLSSEDQLQEQSRFHTNFFQAKKLEEFLSSTSGAERRRNALEHIRALMAQRTSEKPRPESVQMSAPGNKNNNMDKHVAIPVDNEVKEYSKPFLQSGDMLRPTDDRLMETQRLAAEAEQLGHSTLNDLKRQREQLERARKNLYRADEDLDTSNRLMAAMMRRYG
jgi:hypothetical protein